MLARLQTSARQRRALDFSGRTRTEGSEPCNVCGLSTESRSFVGDDISSSSPQHTSPLRAAQRRQITCRPHQIRTPAASFSVSSPLSLSRLFWWPPVSFSPAPSCHTCPKTYSIDHDRSRHFACSPSPLYSCCSTIYPACQPYPFPYGRFLRNVHIFMLFSSARRHDVVGKRDDIKGI